MTINQKMILVFAIGCAMTWTSLSVIQSIAYRYNVIDCILTVSMGACQ